MSSEVTTMMFKQVKVDAGNVSDEAAAILCLAHQLCELASVVATSTNEGKSLARLIAAATTHLSPASAEER